MARKFFSGTTLEQAVLAAARHYGIEPERVAYQEREKKHGFLNLRRKLVIEVDPQGPSLPDGEEIPWRPKLAGVDSSLLEGPENASSNRGSADRERAREGAEKGGDSSAEHPVRGLEAEDAEESSGAITEDGSRRQGLDGDGREGRADMTAEAADDGHSGDRGSAGFQLREDSAERRSIEDTMDGGTGAGAKAGPEAGTGARLDGRAAGRPGGRRQDDRDSGRDRGRRGGDDHRSRGRRRDRGGNDRGVWVTAKSLGAEIESMDDPLDAADDALGEVADFLLYDMQWEISQEVDESIRVELSGDDSDRIVANEAETMRAIEHLLPRLIRSRFGDTMHVSVDCNGFGVQHEAALRSLAEEAAEAVRKSRDSQLLRPMTPADRRLVHVALAEEPGVTTESEGYGFTKRVRISPA